MKLFKIFFIGTLWLIGAFSCKKDIESKQLTGPYFHDFKRWKSADSVSVAYDSTSFFAQPASFIPIDSLSDTIAIEAMSGSSGLVYKLTFQEQNDIFSNFKVSFTEASLTAAAAGGIIITDGPNILIADPVNEIFEFQFKYSLNDSPRYLIDKYYRQ